MRQYVLGHPLAPASSGKECARFYFVTGSPFFLGSLLCVDLLVQEEERLYKQDLAADSDDSDQESSGSGGSRDNSVSARTTGLQCGLARVPFFDSLLAPS